MTAPTARPLREALLVALETGPTVGPDVQRAAWNLALRTKDDTLMVAVTRRDDIDSTILAEAKDRRELPVRVAYLNRPTTSRNELIAMLGSETRAGVFAGVCQDTPLAEQPDLSTLLERRMEDRPTRALAEALLECDGASPRLYALALIEMSARKGLPRTFDRLYRTRAEAIARDSVAASLVIERADFGKNLDKYGAQFDWMTIVLRVRDIASGVRQQFIDRELVPLTAAGTPGSAVHRANRLSAFVKALLDAPDLDAATVSRLRDAAHRDTGLQTVIDRYNPDEVAAAEVARREILAAATSTADADELAHIAATHMRTPGVLAALRANPNLTGAALTSVAVTLLAHNPEAAFDLARTTGAEETVLELYCSVPVSAIKHDRWQSFADPAAAKRRVVERTALRVDAAGRLDGTLGQVVSALPSTDPALGSVPWEALQQWIHGHNRTGAQSTKLCAYLAREQEKALGSDPRKWETIEVLARGFTGTIDDLVAASAAL